MSSRDTSIAQNAFARRVERSVVAASVHATGEWMTANDFSELYQKHQSLVRSVIFQISGLDANVIDDLVQEAFIRIWKGIGDFRGEAQITSWIYRISANVALDHTRMSARRRESSQESLSEAISALPAPDQELGHKQLVEKGLKKLSEDHRAVLVLAYLHDLPLAEVADVLGTSEGTVKSRLHYAKAEFREFLAAQGVKL
jgi:RNA polymerase sigma-70 factor (ECF subfamily)